MKTKLHKSFIRHALALGLALVAIVPNSRGVVDSITPAFSPGIPPATNGNVVYQYVFAGYSTNMLLDQNLLNHSEVYGKTFEYGTVGSAEVISRETDEQILRTQYLPIDSLCGSSTPPPDLFSHCRQSLTFETNLVPNVNVGDCIYTNSDFINGVSGKIRTWRDDSLGNCLTLVTNTTTNSGGGWSITLIRADPAPPCYSIVITNSQLCTSVTGHAEGINWGAYYEMDVFVTAGATNPGSADVAAAMATLGIIPVMNSVSTNVNASASVPILFGGSVSGTNVSFYVYANAPTNSTYSIQESADLINWSVVSTNSSWPSSGILNVQTAFTNSALGFRANVGTTNSLNGLGFANITIVPGWNLIANQLVESGGNDLQNLLSGLPSNSIAYLQNGDAWTFTTSSNNTGVWAPTNFGFGPGQGIFVDVAGSNNVSANFIGDLPQGTWTVNIYTNETIVGPIWPQSASFTTTLGYAASTGDEYWRVLTNGSGSYSSSEYTGTLWRPNDLVPRVGESFLYQTRTNSSWIKTFTVW